MQVIKDAFLLLQADIAWRDKVGVRREGRGGEGRRGIVHTYMELMVGLLITYSTFICNTIMSGFVS